MPGTIRSPLLRVVVLAAFFGALALSGCLTPAKPTPTPTPSPTRAPMPTFTRTPLVAPAATPLPATATAVATSAPSPTFTVAANTATATVNPNVNPLTGLGVADASLLKKRPLHVCIDNDTGARPHFGLNKADIVYEYIMERFYNTRFTAVYWGQEAERIGPMRSMRLVNLELSPQYDALLACQGGSDGALFNIKKDARAAYYEFFDYDYLWMDMNFATGFFNIYGKHANPQVNTNLTQTSTSLLRKWLADNNKEKTAKVAGFTFSAPGSAAPAAMAATTINIPYPSECCAVQWTYDAASQRYLRTMNGEAHSDGATKERISAANVIVVYATHDVSTIDEGYGAMGFRIRLTGEGKASVLRDGLAIAAFWKRTKLTDFMQIVDAQGKPIALHVGNSWIEIAPDVDFTVTF